MRLSHSRRQNISKPLVIMAFALVGVVALIFAGYWFHWDWTGFNEHVGPQVLQYQPAKTLWDWLQLLGILAIPTVVGLGTVWFTTQQHQTDLQIAESQQQEAALQAYLDKMSELLLHEQLRKSSPGDEVQKIGRVLTLTTLPRLSKVGKGTVLTFLFGSGLLIKDQSIIDLGRANLRDAELIAEWLNEADLRGVTLEKAALTGANLSGTDLRGADLKGAYLEYANLSGADLHGADLRGACLYKTNLSGANLNRADLTGVWQYARDQHLSSRRARGVWKQLIAPEQLEQAKSLQDAIMPDGSKHP